MKTKTTAVHKNIFYLVLIFFTGVIALHVSAQTYRTEVSYAELVRRMVALERLAVLPEQGEKTALWSSADQRSSYNRDTDKYFSWYANQDSDQYISYENNGKKILARMDGPGCIWHIWSDSPDSSLLTIFVDGEPVTAMPFAHYFDGRHPPFTYNHLAYTTAGGKNLYIPISYNSSCSVTVDAAWKGRYHISYSSFSPGTRVQAFTVPLSIQGEEALQWVDTFFARRLGTMPFDSFPGKKTSRGEALIDRGETLTIASLTGPRAITALSIKIDFRKDDDRTTALRKLFIQITWDNQTQPAVWAPLGDFFGSAPGVNPYRSLVSGMTHEGFYCYWYMPFAASARIDLINTDTTYYQAKYRILHTALKHPPGSLGYFHAKWHRDIFKLRADRWPDWTVLRTQGQGRFCGMMLHVWNPVPGTVYNYEKKAVYPWWGDGDEKFFIDGERYPSWFGTGTGDYFGAADTPAGFYSRAYHGWTKLSPQYAGHQSCYRWHIADNIPFHLYFEGTLEKYFPNSRPTLYSCVAYWYLSRLGTDPLLPADPGSAVGYFAYPAAGGFTITGTPPGSAVTQKMHAVSGSSWDNHDQLLWTGGQPGDRLHLRLSVPQYGTYTLACVPTKGPGYSRVQFYLDSRKVGVPADLYSSTLKRGFPITLGRHVLLPGPHTFSIEILGANAASGKDYLFGLDTVTFTPEE